VARSTVYVYFANRDELLGACVQSMYDRLKETLAALFEDTAAPLERLRALIRGVLERIDESPAFFRLAMATQSTTTAAGSAAVGGTLMWIGLDVIRLLEEIVDRGVEDGLFRRDVDRDRAVVLIGQQIYGVLSVRAGEPDPVPVDQATEEICDFVWHGLGG
jgi:AcrR family transcriptional regulator